MVIVVVMVIVGEVADSAGIYRTIREGCPFFVEVGFVFGDFLLGICFWVSFWESQANRYPQYHRGKGVGKGIMGIPGQKGGMNPRYPLVEHFVSVTAGIPKCLKPPTSPEMSAPAPIQQQTDLRTPQTDLRTPHPAPRTRHSPGYISFTFTPNDTPKISQNFRYLLVALLMTYISAVPNS